MEEKIRELYQSGKGIKSIAWELEMPVSTVRRRLIAMGVYEGAGRAGHKEEEIHTETFSFSVSGDEEVTRATEIPPLEQWTPCGDVSVVVRDGDGWIVSLGGDFSSELTSPSLEGEQWSGRGVEVACDLRLVSPLSGSFIMGVKDASARFGSEANCILSSGLIPSRWHVKHLCRNSPVVFFKPNSYQRTVVHISSLTVKKIPPTVLKIIVAAPAEEKRFKPGERIDLANNWQADGADIFPCAWSAGAVEINFLTLTSSVYAPLIPETTGKKIKLTLKMRGLSGSFSLSAILGDDEGKTVQEGLIKRDPCTWELERNMEENGHVRIFGKTYGREKIILDESFIEVMS